MQEAKKLNNKPYKLIIVQNVFKTALRKKI